MDCSPSFLIGQSNYFGFGFTTLIWKLLYSVNTARKLPGGENFVFHDYIRFIYMLLVIASVAIIILIKLSD